jgi:hypothetical protein
MLVDTEGVVDDLPLGLDEGVFKGLSLASMLNDEGLELGIELGTVWVSVRPLLGTIPVDTEGVVDELPLGLDEGLFKRLWLGSMLNDDVELGVEDWFPFGLDDGSWTGSLLGSRLNVECKVVGEDQGESTGSFVGPLLGFSLVDVDGADDELPLGVDDGFEEIRTELGVELGMASGASVGSLLGVWAVDGNGAKEWLALGLDDGSLTRVLLGFRLNLEGKVVCKELGDSTGLFAGSMFGTLLIDMDGANDELPLGLDDKYEMGTELGVALREASGTTVGWLLDSWLVDGDGNEEKCSLGLDEGSLSGPLLGSRPNDGDTELGVAVGGIPVGLLFGGWLVASDGVEEKLPLGVDDGSSRPNSEGTRVDAEEDVGSAVIWSSFRVGLEVVVDAGDDDGACVPPTTNVDGILVGSEVDDGSAVSRWSRRVGLFVWSVVGAVLDGNDVAVEMGGNVAATLFSVGLKVITESGNVDGAIVPPSLLNSEGIGVDAAVEVGSTVYCSPFLVGLVVLAAVGDDVGVEVSWSLLNGDGAEVNVDSGETVVDAGDDEGASLSPPWSFDGIGVGSGVDVGSSVSCFSSPVGLVVLAVAEDDVGDEVSRSMLNWDGGDVAVAMGHNDGSTASTVGIEVMGLAGDIDGAHVLPPEPNCEGLGVGPGVDVGSVVSCWSLAVGLGVLAAAGADVGVSWSKLNCDGIDVAVAIGDTVVDAGDNDGACVLPPEPNSKGLGVGSGVNVGSAVSGWSFTVGLVVLAAAGDDDGGSWSILYSDGSRVVVGSGAEVG